MKGFETYQQNSVVTQSPGRLIVLLYEGAIKFLRQAVEELRAGKHCEKGRSIDRAIDIIDELNNSLNVEVGGEVAMNLRRLYLFMERHLHEANAQKDPQRIEEVIALLSDLYEGWKAVAD